MITLLSKLFIKNRGNTRDARVRTAYGLLCGITGIVLNVILCALKFFAGSISGSIAVTADAANNLSDAGSSVVTLVGFKLAGHKPDKGHPFGHGRIEYISGLIVAFIIMIMGFDLGKTSILKIFAPQPVEFSWLTVGILAASVAVKLYMALFNNRIGKRINSAAMKATALDSISDSIATTVVLAATLVSFYTGVHIDGYAGVAVALFVFWAGIRAAKETIAPLLGQPPEQEFVDRIRDIVMSHSDIVGIHDLVVHDYGPGRVMISLHAEVPAANDVLLMHDTIDNIERDLAREMHCEAVIHMDPVVTDDPKLNHLKGDVAEIVAGIAPGLTMHDFRMVTGPTHTNLIFDVVVPFDCKLPDTDVRSAVEQQVRDLPHNCFAVVHVDKAYI